MQNISWKIHTALCLLDYIMKMRVFMRAVLQNNPCGTTKVLQNSGLVVPLFRITTPLVGCSTTKNYIGGTHEIEITFA